MALLEALQEEVYGHLPKEQFENLQRDETIDLLDNFGYVEFNKNGVANTLPTKASINKGIKTFRTELSQSVLKGQVYIPSTADLSERELDYLAELSDLEGEFNLEGFGIEQIKSDPILMRVLNFRLRIFSALDKDVLIGPKFDEHTILALNNLQTWVGLEGLEEIINLTDDFSTLAEKACKNESFGDSKFRNLLFFKYDGHEKIKTDYKWFESYLWRVPEKDLSYYKKQIFDRASLPKPMRVHMDGIAADPVAKFFARLIQVKLWLVGSYDKELDGDMGGFSIDAIQNLYEMVQQTEGDRYDEFVKPDRVLYKLKKGYWALNYKYLLLDGMTKIDWDDEPLEETLSISEPMNNLLSNAKTEEDKNAILTALNDTMTADGEGDKKQRKKKKYRKGKGFFRNMTNFFKKIEEWVIDKISDLINAIKNFFKWIKNGVTYLLREIKEAFSKIKMALAFFFSKRMITTMGANGSGQLITDFDTDFDAVNMVTGTLGAGTAKDHDTKGLAITEAMESTFKILQVALPLMIQVASGPLGWIKAGLSIVKLLFKEKFDGKFNLLKLA